MKKIVFTFFAFFMCCFFINLNAQNSKKSTQPVYYKSNVNEPLTSKEFDYLKEVYKDNLDEKILGNPAMLKATKNLLRNRLVVKRIDGNVNSDKYQNLSEIPLFNHYNKNLVKDASYNTSNFNFLKYDLPFYGGPTKMFKIFNTNYYLILKSNSIKL